MEKILSKLQEICEPVIKYLEQNHDPHTKIVVSMDSIEVTQTEIRIPIDNNGN